MFAGPNQPLHSSFFLSFYRPCAHCQPPRLLEEDIVQRRDNCQANNAPARPDDLLVREPNTNVPQQMPNTVERVEEHGERKEALQRNLGSRGPRGDRRYHRRSLEVPSRVRRSQVREAEEIQGARERDTRDAVE